MKKKALVLGLLAGTISSATALAQDIEAFDNGGGVTRPYTHSGTQLLRSFFFQYSSQDHHIRAIGISPDTPSSGQVQLIYQDRNGDDDYYYHVQHYDAPSSGIQSFYYGRDVCVGVCTRTITRPTGDYIFVLRGFYVYFQNEDHHIDRFAILENNGQLTVAFNDQNDNDSYVWELQYAYVPRSRFSSLGEATGAARGAQGRAIPVGTSVIRGFDLDFRSDDHHIDEIGVFQWGHGSVDAYYSDQDDNDIFDWKVRWGIMN